MSKFTKMWRIKHDEPLTYNERIINSACNIIEKQDKQIEKLKATKCPPISEGDSCICPIEELEVANKRLQNDYNCVASLCDSMDEFGEPMKDMQWTNLGERIYEIVVEQAQRIKDLEAALQRIDNWAKAYPIKVFPEPDLVEVHEVLKAHGLSLDAVSASNMRHVLDGVKDIVEQALTPRT